MLACILFVFGTLTEYAGILFAMGIEPTPEEAENNKKDKKERDKLENMNAQLAPQHPSHPW